MNPISTITPDQAVSEVKAWTTAIVAISGLVFTAAGAIYLAYKNSGLSAKVDALLAKSTLHDKQIAVNTQNIATTAEATPADVKLVPMPAAPTTPIAPMIPSQSQNPSQGK